MKLEVEDMAVLEKLYSIEDAAKQLGGISPHTVVMWFSKGKLQRTKVGRRTMVAESELLRIQNVGGVSIVSGSRRRPKEAVVQ
jgi:excisionase family DNA binding protein